MKIKNIVFVLLLGIVLGVIYGVAYSAYKITTNWYIVYELYNLAVFNLCSSINGAIVYGVLTALVLYTAAYYAMKRTKYSSLLEQVIKKGNKIIKITGITAIAVMIIINAATIVMNKDAKGKPNVILIICDSLRPDRLGCYGYKRDTSKNIDEFSKNAYIFKNAYTQAPCTQPSMMNIMSSKYFSTVPAKDKYVTMAEYFKSQGYKTAAFISQHLLFDKLSNLKQGFDIYDTKTELSNDKYEMALKKAETVTADALKWIKKSRNKPYFIWMVCFEPHYPYDPPEKFKGYYTKEKSFSRDWRTVIEAKAMSGREKLVPERLKKFASDAYDEKVRYLDYALGNFFKELKEMSSYDNTVIVLTADHGEALGEEGVWLHGAFLDDSEIRIPLLIKMPGRNSQITVNETVQSIDIYPTLLEYTAGKYIPPYYEKLEGRSLMPLISGNKESENWFSASFWKYQGCIVEDSYKYWDYEGEIFFTLDGTTIKEYDKEKEKIFKKLKEKLNNIFSSYVGEKSNIEETVKKLNALGYLNK